MYDRILVPLDGSEYSECSLDHVRAVATGCHSGEVILLRVVEPLPQADDSSLSWREKAEKGAEALARDYLTQMAGGLKSQGLAVRTAMARGRAAEQILDYARNNNVDLIVMSTHGHSGLGRWVYGSVADRVVSHSPVPC